MNLPERSADLGVSRVLHSAAWLENKGQPNGVGGNKGFGHFRKRAKKLKSGILRFECHVAGCN